MIQLSLETAALRIVKHPYAKSEKLDPYFRIFFLILFRGNRQIPGLATGAVGHSLF